MADFLTNAASGGFRIGGPGGVLSNFANLRNLEGQIEQQDQIKQQQQQSANLQNTLGNLVRLETLGAQGGTPEQFQSMLQQNITTAEQAGGNAGDSQQALEVLQNQGVEGLKNFLGQGRAVFEQQGVIEPVKQQQPQTGRFKVQDGVVIDSVTGETKQLDDTFKRLNDETKKIEGQEKKADALRKEVIGFGKELGFFDIFSAHGRIQASNDGTAAGDMALIFNFMKMQDPGSTVREGEFASARNAGGVETRVINLYNNLRTGEQLGTTQRANFTDLASKLFNRGKTDYQSIIKPILNIGKNRGLTEVDILGENFFGSFDNVLQPEVVEQPAPVADEVPPMLAKPVDGNLLLPNQQAPQQQPLLQQLTSPSGISFTVE